MASDNVPEVLLRVPAELIVKCKGLALDMGGSALKFVFRTKEDVEKANENGKFGYLRLVTFGRSILKQGLDYVSHRSFVTTADGDDGQPTSVYTTGMGCTEFRKLIIQTLNIRMENVSELDCFVKAFTYLADHLPRSELLEPFLVDASTDAIEFAENFFEVRLALMTENFTKSLNFSTKGVSKEDVLKGTGRHDAATIDPPSTRPLSEAESDVFPCLFVMCGSGIGFLQINEDRSFGLFDVSHLGGKGFLGIGLLLTNSEVAITNTPSFFEFDVEPLAMRRPRCCTRVSQSYHELIELAAKGNYRNVHQYSNEACGDEVVASEEDDSVYKNWFMNDKIKPSLLFSFGKAAARQNTYSREDIAAAWLHWFVMDLVHTLALNAQKNNIYRVFFCGGFCENELVRYYITQEVALRNMLASVVMQKTGHITIDFIKPGQHLGAIGCLLNGLEKFI